MKLRRRLIETRRASARVAAARQRTARCTTSLRRRVDTDPLLCVATVGGGGLVAGYLTGRHGKSVFGLWNDPALRWLLGLLGPGA